MSSDPPPVSSTEPAAPVYTDRALWLLFAVTMVAVGNVSSVSPAFPQMVDALGITRAEVAWVVTAYALPGILSAPLAGVLADRIGRNACSCRRSFSSASPGRPVRWRVRSRC
jgi:MFS family permease